MYVTLMGEKKKKKKAYPVKATKEIIRSCSHFL